MEYGFQPHQRGGREYLFSWSVMRSSTFLDVKHACGDVFRAYKQELLNVAGTEDEDPNVVVVAEDCEL